MMSDYALPAVLTKDILEYWSGLVDELVKFSVAIRPVWQDLPAIFTQKLPYDSTDLKDPSYGPSVEPLFPACVHGGYARARFLKDGTVFTTDAPDKLKNWYDMFWQPFSKACLTGDSDAGRIARAEILQSDMGLLCDPSFTLNDDQLIAQYSQPCGVLPLWASLIGIDIAFLYSVDLTGHTWLQSAIVTQPAAAMVLLRVGEARLIKATVDTIRSVYEYDNLKRLLMTDADGIAHDFVKSTQDYIVRKYEILDKEKGHTGTVHVPAEWLAGWLKEISMEFQLVRKWFDEESGHNTNFVVDHSDSPACAQSGAANLCRLPSCVISPNPYSEQATFGNASGPQPDQGASHDDK